MNYKWLFNKTTIFKFASTLFLILGIFLCFDRIQNIAISYGSTLSNKLLDSSNWHSILQRWAIVALLLSLFFAVLFRSQINNRSFQKFIVNDSHNTKYKIRIYIILACAVSFAMRWLISLVGWNNDFPEWINCGRIVSEGNNIYANTIRYNYGPVFSVILGGLWKFVGYFSDQISTFRLLIILFLTLVDGMISFLIWQKFRRLDFSYLYLFNPISLVVVGYQNQFDNIAILLAFGAVLLMERKNFWYISLILLVVSVSTKHILALFPIWFLFRNQTSIKQRVTPILVVFIGFCVSFVPFLPEGKEGIIQHVIQYKAMDNYPILIPFLDWGHLDFFNLIHRHTRLIFAATLVAVGWFVRRLSILESFLIYLIFVVALSSAIFNNYLVIPVLALVLYPTLLSYIYIGLAGLLMFLHQDQLNLIQSVQDPSFRYLFTFDSSLIYSILCYILLIHGIFMIVRLNLKFALAKI